MKTRTKVALTALCALLLVAASVLGTLAYLQDSTDDVVNTFTAGNVTIDLDETDVDLYGLKDGETRVKANELKLVPNHTYVKDPTIHVAAGSENCYVFAKVVNGLAAIEANGSKIADQMEAKGWKLVTGETDVYYFAGALEGVTAEVDGTVVPGGKDVAVFDTLNIKADADVSAYATATNANAKITITGYAVQKDNFDSAEEAWDATFKA